MTLTNLNKKKIDELRKIYNDIVEENNDEIDKELLLKMNKKELIEKIKLLDKEINETLDNIEENDDEEYTISVPSDNTEDDKTQPIYASPKWNEYILSKFEDDELFNGSPTCDGCRRVVEEIIGPIVSFEIKQCFPASRDNNGTSTVVVSLEILITNESHPLYGKIMKIDEVADVNMGNTEPPYNRFTSATAATRAEGRALRKALRLKGICTVEEISNIDETTDVIWEPDEPITTSQINVIDMMCSRMNIDVLKFINFGKNNYDNINEVSKNCALKMIQELNKYQKDKKNIPNSLVGYQKDWR